MGAEAPLEIAEPRQVPDAGLELHGFDGLVQELDDPRIECCHLVSASWSTVTITMGFSA